MAETVCDTYVAAYCDYVTQNQTGLVPQRYKTPGGLPLGKWVNKQRSGYANETLSPERATLLNSLPSWSWQGNLDKWDQQYSALLGYIETTGRLPRQDEPGFEKLGSWARQQRRRYHWGTLNKEREQRLEQIPLWVWKQAPKVSPTPRVAKIRPRDARGLKVCEVRWAHEQLNGTEPCATLIVADTATLEELVYGLLDAIAFDNAHLWQLRTPDVPLGSRRLGSRHATWNPPDDWLHYEYYWEPESRLDLPESVQWTDEHTVGSVVAHKDELWLLYDYGDWNRFRLRFYDLDANTDRVRNIRHKLPTDLKTPFIVSSKQLDQHGNRWEDSEGEYRIELTWANGDKTDISFDRPIFLGR